MPTAGLVLLEEADGRAEWLARAADALVTNGRTGAAVVLFGLSETPGGEVAGLAFLSAGVVDGLNVATDSIAPATRHTARMLASSGMKFPCAANGAKGPASRRNRVRRRWARSSRW